jgi:hypothetical protein
VSLAPDRAGTSERNTPELKVTRSANWRDESACLHADLDLFFPDQHDQTRAASDQ